MNRDVMLGTLRLNLTATRNGVTISYYDQDRRHHRGLQKVKIGFLTPEEIRSGATDTEIDVSPILPIAGEMLDEIGRRRQGGGAAAA